MLILVDVVLVLHVTFVVFVVGGGVLAVRWPRLAWIHLPAVAWGVWVELAGWTCPLTPLENWLRAHGGESPYASGFLDRYLIPLLYPADLTREVQYVLGVAVVVMNAVVYGWVAHRRFAGYANRHANVTSSFGTSR